MSVLHGILGALVVLALITVWLVFRLATDFAITISIAVLGLGLGLLSILVSGPPGWAKWITTATTVVLACLIVWQVVRTNPLRVMRFKESTRLNWLNKLWISNRVYGFKAFLERIGLDVPSAMPTVEIVTKAKGGSIGASLSRDPATGEPTLFSTMRIDDVHLGEANAAIHAYAGYLQLRVQYPASWQPSPMPPLPPPQSDAVAFQKWIAEHVDTPAAKEGAWRMRAVVGTMIYLVDSYSSKRSDEESPPWTGALWSIRRRCGKRFTDRLAAELLNIIATDKGGWDNEKNYVSNHFRRADERVDSEMANWPVIEEILAGK